MGIQIRSLQKEDIPGIARVHADGWRTAYTHFMPPEHLAGLTCEKTADWMRQWIYEREQPLTGFVAVDGDCDDSNRHGGDHHGDLIIGFSLAGPNEDEPRGYPGEIYKLFVDSGYQGRGIGLKLLYAAVSALKQQGYASLIIWVFKEARSAGFYRALGGQVVLEILEPFEDKNLEVLIFGWQTGDLLRTLQTKIDRN